MFIYNKQKTIEQKHNQRTKNMYVISKSRQGILYICYTIFQIFEKPKNNACPILSIIGFENKYDHIIDLIELQFLPNNQYMGPYVFIHVLFNFKKYPLIFLTLKFWKMFFEISGCEAPTKRVKTW